MKYVGWWALVLVLVVLGAAGCGRGGGDEVILDMEDSGSEVTLSSGQILVIRLDSNPSTGYGWGRTDADSTVLVQDEDAEFKEGASGQGLVGASGVETLRFKAAQAGETTLELGYRRPWEKGVDPLDVFQVRVVVRK